MATTAYIVLALCALAHGAILGRPVLDGRIVGGEDASIEDFPYQLSLLKYDYHYCGAAIISDEWVLTAAHCTYGLEAWALSIRAGSSIKHVGGSVHQVEQIIQHEEYDTNTVDYDFALLKVSPKFNLGQAGVKTIALTDSEPAVGTNCVVSGWGSLASSGIPTSQLKVVSVPIYDHDKCNVIYEDGLTDRMICAGLDAGGKDTCQGDSGGPLVADGKLVGVVSFGDGCGEPNNPGVYSNIANQRAWIKKNSGI